MSVKIGLGSKHEARAIRFNSKLTPYGQLDMKGREIIAALEEEFLAVELEERRQGMERMKRNSDQGLWWIRKRLSEIPKSIFKLVLNRILCHFKGHRFLVNESICGMCAMPLPNSTKLFFYPEDFDRPPPPPPKTDCGTKVDSGP